MVTLAAMPSTSVALVVTRAATLGVANGIAVAAGIVLGDLIFVLMAVLGLSVIAEMMGSVFLVIKYLGGAYLIWLGINLMRSPAEQSQSIHQKNATGNLFTSFIAGLALTLGDLKAIFFYLSLFPMFVAMEHMAVSDIIWIMLITIFMVGGVKIGYAVSAEHVVRRSQGLHLGKPAKVIGGSMMIGAGTCLILKQ